MPLIKRSYLFTPLLRSKGMKVKKLAKLLKMHPVMLANYTGGKLPLLNPFFR